MRRLCGVCTTRSHLARQASHRGWAASDRPTQSERSKVSGYALPPQFVRDQPQVLGLGMTTQWLEWSQFATSNAIEWSVATAPATLDMALLEGHPQSPTGELSVHLAQVLRFQFQ